MKTFVMKLFFVNLLFCFGVAFIFENSTVDFTTNPNFFQIETNTTLSCSVNNFSLNDYSVYKINYYFNFSNENINNLFASYEVIKCNFCFLFI